MLILMVASLVAQQSVTSQPGISIIGPQLSGWTGEYAVQGDKRSCSTKTSTGDREVDVLGCKAFKVCADGLAPRIKASDDTSISQEARAAMKEDVKQDLFACIAGKRVALITELAKERRRSLRTGPAAFKETNLPKDSDE